MPGGKSRGVSGLLWLGAVVSGPWEMEWQMLRNELKLFLFCFVFFPAEILCSRDVLCKRKTVSRSKERPIQCTAIDEK